MNEGGFVARSPSRARGRQKGEPHGAGHHLGIGGVRGQSADLRCCLGPRPGASAEGRAERAFVGCIWRGRCRRRVRSEIADSTAPGPGGVLTGRLEGGLYVYETIFFYRHNSRAHDRAQAARACRSTALTTPELTVSGPSGPGPGRPGHVRERTCPSASISRLAPGSEITPACGGRVSFVTETPSRASR